MTDNESTTFTFQTTIIGQLTIHKDELGDGTDGSRNDAARARIEETIMRMAEPGAGPLVFAEVNAGEIVFRDIGYVEHDAFIKPVAVYLKEQQG